MPVHMTMLMRYSTASDDVSLLSPTTYLGNHRLICLMRDVVNPSHLLLLLFFPGNFQGRRLPGIQVLFFDGCS